MKYLPMLIVLCLILTGCSPTKPEAEPLKLVNSVEIDFQLQQEHLKRLYTDAEKIDVILHYLHRLSPHGSANSDPEQLIGERCKITVRMSGGQAHTYRIQGKQYLSVDLKPWKNISRDRCAVLYHLVRRIESDVTLAPTALTEKSVSVKSKRRN